MSKFLFIKNLEELNYIKRNLPHLLTTHKIITVCSLPWLQLYSEGFQVEQVSDYISADELRDIVENSRIFSKEWYKPFEQLLNYRGVNLGELIRLDQVWFFRELIASSFVFQRIIDVHKPDGVTLFADLDVPSLGASQFNGTSDIFASTVIWMCEGRKIPIHKLFFRDELGKIINRFWWRLKRKITRYLPYALFFYRYLKRITENIIYHYKPERMLLRTLPKTAHKKLAVALGSGFELLILKEVMQTLSELADFHIVFLNIGYSFDTSHLKDRAGLDSDTILKFVCLDDFNHSVFPKSPGIISSLKKARKCLDAGITFKSGTLPLNLSELLRNPYLAVQFDFVWGDYFFEAVSMIDKLYQLYRLWNPDLVIVANAIGYTQRAIAELAGSFEAKSITVPHGWVGDIDHYDFKSDLFFAWGELSKTQLIEEFNKSADNIAVVGAIQFEKIIPSPEKFPDDRVKGIKQMFGLRQDAKVVAIITSGLPQSVFSMIDMKRFLGFWESIKCFISSHPQIDFIIRYHPYCETADWYRQLVINFKQPNLEIIEGQRLESFLPAVDAGIIIGEGTTAGYLCILFGVPIIVFRRFMRATVFNTVEAWSQDNGLLVAEQEDDLASLLMQLLNDNNFSKETLKKEQNFLDKSLLIRDRKTGERMIKALEKLDN